MNFGHFFFFVLAVLISGTCTRTGTFAFTLPSNLNRRAFVETVIVASASTLVDRPIAVAMEQDLYKDFITTDSGLRYKVVKEGSGDPPVLGASVTAHYTGWLDGFGSSKKFDSSYDRGRPFRFTVGKGQVIRGWDESFSSMAVGEKRQVIIPARLGYGDRGAGGIIPGGATLYFDVELLGIGNGGA